MTLASCYIAKPRRVSTVARALVCLQFVTCSVLSMVRLPLRPKIPCLYPANPPDQSGCHDRRSQAFADAAVAKSVVHDKHGGSASLSARAVPRPLTNANARCAKGAPCPTGYQFFSRAIIGRVPDMPMDFRALSHLHLDSYVQRDREGPAHAARPEPGLKSFAH